MSYEIVTVCEFHPFDEPVEAEVWVIGENDCIPVCGSEECAALAVAEVGELVADDGRGVLFEPVVNP